MSDTGSRLQKIQTKKGGSPEKHMIKTTDNNSQLKLLNLLNNSESVLGVILKRGISALSDDNKGFTNTILCINQLSRMYITKMGPRSWSNAKYSSLT